MSNRIKIGICSVACTLLLFGLAALCYWRSEVSERHLERVNFAYANLSGYLELSSAIFKHFKLARRDLLGPDHIMTIDLFSVEDQFTEMLDNMHQLELQELAHTPEQSFDELLVLEEISLELQAIFQELHLAARLLSLGHDEEAYETINKSLTERVDGRINSLIEQIVSHEQNQIDRVRQAAARVSDLSKASTGVFAVFIFFFSSFLLYYLIVSYPHKIAMLNEGISNFSKGDLNFRIQCSGNDEFSGMASQLNEMADQLKHERQVLSKVTEGLEETIKSRTEELEDANRSLQTRDQMRTQFFADIGHELRTPITIIRGEAELSRRTQNLDSDTLKQSMLRIEVAAEELSEFIADVFYLARQQSGIDELALEKIDLNRLCDDVVTHFTPMVERRGGKLTYFGEPEGSALAVDQIKLRRAIGILINNAVEHCQPGVSIEVKLSRGNRVWTIGCHDDGPGIADIDKHLVFERFVRGPNHTPHGSGIGLAIARAIVQAHGGKIWVDPERQSGTSIFFTLPI